MGPHEPARRRVGAEINRRAALGEVPLGVSGRGVRIPPTSTTSDRLVVAAR